MGPTADNPTLTKETVKENILEAYLKGLASNGQRYKTFFRCNVFINWHSKLACTAVKHLNSSLIFVDSGLKHTHQSGALKEHHKCASKC